MANKYSNWNNASNYSHTEYVKQTLPPYIKVLELYQSQTTFILKESDVIPSLNKIYTNLNIIDIEIIARIASSCGLTAFQLKLYLQMAEYHISQPELKNRLYCLVNLGLIRNMIFKDISPTTINQNTDVVTQYYYLCNSGIEIAKALGSSTISPKQSRTLKTKYGHFHFVLSNILWNQIVINQLLYNSNIKHFQLQKKEFFNNNSFYVPLKLRTSKNSYFFEYISELSFKHNRLQNLLKQWHIYQKEHPIPFILVLVCKNKSIMDMLLHHPAIYTIPEFRIMVSCSEEWFQTTSGKLYFQTEYHGCSAYLTINDL